MTTGRSLPDVLRSIMDRLASDGIPLPEDEHDVIIRAVMDKGRPEDRAHIARIRAKYDETRTTPVVSPVSPLAQLHVPALFEHTSFGTWQLWGTPEHQDRQRLILRTAQRYVHIYPAVPPLCVLRGDPGTGKGHIAWSIAKALASPPAARTGIRVVKLPDLIHDLRAWWGSKGDSPKAKGAEAARLKYWRGLDLLVIDEVSRHAFHGNPTAHLYEIVDARYESGRRTILTTNESPADFKALVQPALWSRIGAKGMWEFAWGDFRGR